MLLFSEKDLDEVLQIPQVFINVSKGQVASNEDLKSSFGSIDHNEIILEILKKGELQIGGKERQAQQDQTHKEILQIIAAKCINPTNKRPYPTSILEKTLNELSFNISTTKSAKTQALEAIKLLVSKQIIPIARAKMKVRIAVTQSAKEIKKYADKLKSSFIVETEDEDWNDNEWELIGFIDPGNFRALDEMLRVEAKGKARLELLETAVVQQGDESL